MEQTSEIRALDHVADLMTEAHELRAEIARLTRERDEAIAVAVWAAKYGAVSWRNDMLTYSKQEAPIPYIRHDGTDADIYRALKQAKGE